MFKLESNKYSIDTFFPAGLVSKEILLSGYFALMAYIEGKAQMESPIEPVLKIRILPFLKLDVFEKRRYFKVEIIWFLIQ